MKDKTNNTSNKRVHQTLIVFGLLQRKKQKTSLCTITLKHPFEEIKLLCYFPSPLLRIVFKYMHVQFPFVLLL